MFVDNYNFPQLLNKVNKDAKILITIRSQYTIIPSIYSLYVKKGGQLNFNNYLHLILKNLKFSFNKLLESYLKFFKREKILIVFFEELIQNPNQYISKILKFFEYEKKIDISIRHEYQNASPSFRQVYCTNLINRLLNLEIPTRYMCHEERHKLLNNLRRRRKYLHPVFFVLSKFDKIFGKKKLLLNNKQKLLIKKTYHSDNEKLFKKFNNANFRGRYP